MQKSSQKTCAACYFYVPSYTKKAKAYGYNHAFILKVCISVCIYMVSRFNCSIAHMSIYDWMLIDNEENANLDVIK